MISNKNSTNKPGFEPVIITRAEHNLSRKMVSKNALKVLYRLSQAGYQAYLAGGSVRDLLLERKPKDFDVVTDALPKQIRALFRNCRLIGRRFRLAHIHFGKEVIEVSTFRAPHHITSPSDGVTTEAGRIIRDNVYGSMEEDVWRRDFTVNALFYDIKTFAIIDYVGGMEDLKKRQLRLIGEPRKRYIEDPVRLFRAVRFAAKLDFTIHKDTALPIYDSGHLLEGISPSRLFNEVLKLFIGGDALKSFMALRQYALLQYLFPMTNDTLNQQEKETAISTFLSRALEQVDRLHAEQNAAALSFFLAIVLWEPLQQVTKKQIAEGLNAMDALRCAADIIFSKQISCAAIPRRFSRITRDIWFLQYRLINSPAKYKKRLFAQSYFSIAYDFLCLRHQAGEDLATTVKKWNDYKKERKEKSETDTIYSS